MKTEFVEKLLKKIVDEINDNHGYPKILLKQQNIVKEHMSISGGNGRMWIAPNGLGIDVSLSGISLENELQPKMSSLFGRDCDGHKQVNSNTGIIRQPYWRTEDFNQIRKAIETYAKTNK